MAVRIGTDVIEIERIRRALERPGFRDRCFTRDEQAYCESRRNPAESYAARFCGKEAVGKALGCGVLFTWKEIEIVGPPKPGVTLAGKTLRLRGAGWHERHRRLADALAHDRRRDVRRRSRDAARAASPAAPAVMHEPLYTAAEMRAAEERYPGYPGSAGELMERAGAAVAAEVLRAYPEARRIAAVCGGGANGGDGRIAARILREAGRDVVETDDPAGASADLVIDALFGTGFHGAPRPDAAAVIERVNAGAASVVSVDLPSGVDASTGEIAGAAVEADLTVTFHGRKVGLVVAPGRFHAGRVVVADIGLEAAPTAILRATPALLARVPRRGTHDTKFTSGALLVVGGAPGTTSAAVLAATAALRADAGYVTLAVPAEALPVAEALALEPVKRGFEWADAAETLEPDVARSSALALGPGLGRSDDARALVRALLEGSTLPAVVDADGLFGLEPAAPRGADRPHAARR